jgi:hypothetical protein
MFASSSRGAPGQRLGRLSRSSKFGLEASNLGSSATTRPLSGAPWANSSSRIAEEGKSKVLSGALLLAAERVSSPPRYAGPDRVNRPLPATVWRSKAATPQVAWRQPAPHPPPRPPTPAGPPSLSPLRPARYVTIRRVHCLFEGSAQLPRASQDLQRVPQPFSARLRAPSVAAVLDPLVARSRPTRAQTRTRAARARLIRRITTRLRLDLGVGGPAALGECAPGPGRCGRIRRPRG